MDLQSILLVIKMLKVFHIEYFVKNKKGQTSIKMIFTNEPIIDFTVLMK